MNLINILILLFLLSAFAIGILLNGEDISLIDSSLNNASQVINNITLTYSVPEGGTSIPNVEGIYLVLEKYIHFLGTFVLEIMRAGITFGHDNPSYFEADTIVSFMKLIIILIIISLLIQPLFYVGVCLVLLFMWIGDKLKKKKLNSKEKIK